MGIDGIDEEKGVIDLHSLLPGEGDSVMIVNCGNHFEMRQYTHTHGERIYLTDDDIKHLKAGSITWN